MPLEGVLGGDFGALVLFAPKLLGLPLVLRLRLALLLVGFAITTEHDSPRARVLPERGEVARSSEDEVESMLSAS